MVVTVIQNTLSLFALLLSPANHVLHSYISHLQRTLSFDSNCLMDMFEHGELALGNKFKIKILNEGRKERLVSQHKPNQVLAVLTEESMKVFLYCLYRSSRPYKARTN